MAKTCGYNRHFFGWINKHVQTRSSCHCVRKAEERRSVVCHILKSTYFYIFTAVMRHASARLIVYVKTCHAYCTRLTETEATGRGLDTLTFQGLNRTCALRGGICCSRHDVVCVPSLRACVRSCAACSVMIQGSWGVVRPPLSTSEYASRRRIQ